jgi:hypothetical protein
MSEYDRIESLERIFRKYIKQYGIGDVMVGIHNAMCHGEVVKCTDKQLGKFYKHLDKASKVSRKMGKI